MNNEVSSEGISPVPIQFAGTKLLNSFNKPTILKNCLTCWETVPRTLEEFSESYGTILFDFRVVPRKSHGEGPVWEGDADFVQATIPQFKDWLENVSMSENNKNPLAKYPSAEFWVYSSYNYMFQVFPEDSAILKSVDWKPLGFEGRSGKDSTFWIGSSGAYTPCHFDTYGCNLVAQICGRKRWILFPPEDGDSLYPTRVPYEESSVFSSVNILNPDLRAHPLFKRCHPYIVTLGPGDVLFVPKQWWHFVQSLDASVSINTWIELPKDSDIPTRLEEAVVRVLMTSLIPTYEPSYETWINPNEEFVSTEETLNYVLQNLQHLRKVDNRDAEVLKPDSVKTFIQSNTASRPHKLARLSDCSDVHSSKSLENSIKGNPCVTVIHPSNFSELMRTLDVDMSPSMCLPCSDDITPKDIINCIVHPEVISLISQKLKHLSKSGLPQSSARNLSKTEMCDIVKS